MAVLAASSATEPGTVSKASQGLISYNSSSRINLPRDAWLLESFKCGFYTSGGQEKRFVGTVCITSMGTAFVI